MEIKEIIYFDELDSTNLKIHEMALDGAKEGTVVVANSQTAGKGRRGRKWESPADGNLYMSVLLRPKLETVRTSMVTLVMAYSIANVLRNQKCEGVRIKWPNDLILSGRKVCGILTELHLNGDEIDHVVVGVGLNVNAQNFPNDLADKATSLYLETGSKGNVQTIAKDIIASFREEYERFMECKDLSFMQSEYNELLINRNTQVKVLEPGNEYFAYAFGINENGELLVRKSDGSLETIYAGEVSVRGVYGYV